MVLLRIPLLNRLQPFRANPISLAPISHWDFHSWFFVDCTPFPLAEGISTLVDSDFKPAKARILSSVISNPSADSQDKSPPCPKHGNSNKGKIEEGKLSQFSRSPIFRPMQEKELPEELSPEAALLLNTLHEELYLHLQPGPVTTNFSSRHLLKSAAEKLGHRHQEIAKWLSGSDLKKVALFGCPSTERKTVFASKRLRSFFHVQEDIICRGCKLKASCNFVNQRVSRVDRVILADVMRLLTVLTFEDVPRQLSIPTDLKLSVNKLVKEAVNLSQ